MTIFKNGKGQLSQIKEVPFQLERDIQQLVEGNLRSIMGLDVVKSEFSIKNKRIDTLAFDPQSNAFIIIEYKRDRNSSVVDQGFTYLSLMLENKADFILEFNESSKKTLKRSDVDWSQSRVVFVSPSFTENQVLATNFKDIGIELWEIKGFEGGLISVNQIKKSKSAESIKPLAQKNQKFKSVQDEIKVYSEEDHLEGKSEEVIALYESFKQAILNLTDGIEVVPRGRRINFRKERIICDINIQSKGLKMWINLKMGELDDPRDIARDVSNLGHWGNGDYEIQVKDTSKLEYIMSLVKQAINTPE
ncbi:DUF5655 domain-containing protein [uncultured Imperialibacter sp.]|uniref:DUF5655 domain-containing protein n=1 Tax=uncultured Imperialibacter sp. TaxID=1672639 RepID=UPI0030D78A06|tara:strand:+ start:51986 stop:52900 length:915 start_codon:yes stop_codon:yes gene_type:complete